MEIGETGVAHQDAASQAKILSFVSAKGGTGKTILAATCASLLMSMGKRVLVIDTDFSTRGLSLFLLDTLSFGNPEIGPESCLADILINEIDSQKIEPLTIPHKKGDFRIFLPNANFRRGGAPEEKLLGSSTGNRSSEAIETRYLKLLRTIRERFRTRFDYIVMDTRGGYDYTSRVPAVIADAYIVVLEADSISIQQVNGLLENIREFGKAVETSPRHGGFIINKALFFPEEGKEMSLQLERFYGSKTLGVIPADRNAISAYQTREIPYQKNPGSEVSYYSLLALEPLFLSFRSGEIIRELGSLKRFIHSSWRLGEIVRFCDRVIPIVLLFFLAAGLLAFISYQVGMTWMTPKLIVSAMVPIVGIASIAPLIRTMVVQQGSGSIRFKPWIAPSLVTMSSIGLFISAIPWITTSLSANQFLNELRKQQSYVRNLTQEKQSASESLSETNTQLQIFRAKTDDLENQIENLKHHADRLAAERAQLKADLARALAKVK